MNGNLAGCIFRIELLYNCFLNVSVTIFQRSCHTIKKFSYVLLGGVDLIKQNLFKNLNLILVNLFICFSFVACQANQIPSDKTTPLENQTERIEKTQGVHPTTTYTPTLFPTPTQLPTPTFTPSPMPSPTPNYPVELGETIYPSNQVISTENINDLIMLAQWGDQVWDLEISPDGFILAIAGDRAIYLFDLERKTITKKFEAEQTADHFGNIIFHPDNMSIAALKGNVIFTWDLTTGEKLGVFQGDAECGEIKQFLFSRAGSLILGCNTQIQKWVNGEKTLAIPLDFSFRGMALSSDEKTLITQLFSMVDFDRDGPWALEGEGEAVAWDIDEGIKIKVIRDYKNFDPINIQLSQDDKLIGLVETFYSNYMPGSSILTILDKSDFSFKCQLEIPSLSDKFIFSNLENLIYFGGNLYDSNCRYISSINTLTDYYGSLYGITFTKDDSKIIFSSRKHGINIYQIEDGASTSIPGFYVGPFDDIRFSSTGSQILSLSTESVAYLFNLPDLNQSNTFMSSDHWWDQTDFVENDKKILVMGRSLSAIDIESLEVSNEIQIDPYHLAYAISEDQTEAIIAVGDGINNSLIYMVDLIEWKVIKTLFVQSGWVNKIDYLSEKGYVAIYSVLPTGEAGEVSLYQSSENSIEKLLSIQISNPNPIPSLAFISDELVAYTDASSLHIIDINSGGEVFYVDKVIYSIALSPDKHILVFPEWEKSLIFLDINKFEIMAEFDVSGVSALNFSPDGKYLCLGGYGTMFLYGVKDW